MTSFSGLVLFQALFRRIGLRRRLSVCAKGLAWQGSYSLATIALLLITHLMLGWRRLRELDYYRDDPMFRRVLGLKRVPNVSTLSRAVRNLPPEFEERYRALSRDLVIERLLAEHLRTVTIDLDGSVLSTKSRCTEGTAIGFNRKSKGSRSYYPLFATVAQTGQVLDHLFRSGNVHDSNGATEFLFACVESLREAGYRGRIESRMDAAFFSDDHLFLLALENVDFSASVPFERFPDLKQAVENRKRWRTIDDTWSFFEPPWKPKSWDAGLRIVVYRQRKKVPTKGPIQLELWTPIHHEFEYKVVVTNKTVSARALLKFHNGRGSQEGIFADIKTHSGASYIPTRRALGNRVYLDSAILAHNLTRELQMITLPRARGSNLKRAALWIFEKASTLRNTVIRRAGRLTRPEGRLTLTMAANKATKEKLLGLLSALDQAA